MVHGAGLCVGVDVISVAEVEASLRRFGSRYTRRVYTEVELADTAGPSQPAGLAARFAAKEAVIKALAPTDTPLPWSSIEVRRGVAGRPELVLHGEAARLAAERGVTCFAVSLTHDAGIAMATVVAATVSRRSVRYWARGRIPSRRGRRGRP